MLEPQLGVDPRRAVDPFRLAVHLTDPLAQLAIGKLAPARMTPLPGIEPLTRDSDDPAQQGDGELCGLLGDEPEPAHGRSLSLMKKTAARFRISRSCRSTLFLRSSSRKRARSSLVAGPLARDHASRLSLLAFLGAGARGAGVWT